MSRTAFLFQIKELVELPVRLSDYPSLEQSSFGYRANDLWRVIANQICVDNEYFFCGLEDGELESDLALLSDDRLRSLQINLRAWREEGVKRFQSEFRKFYDLKMLTPAEHSKHFVITSKTPLGPGSGAANPISKLAPKLTPLILERFVFEVFNYAFEETIAEDSDGSYFLSRFEPEVWWGKWNKCFGVKGAKYFVDCLTDIGFSRESRTPYLCIDVDFSTPRAHAYPVSASDIAGEPLCLDDLQGYGLGKPKES